MHLMAVVHDELNLCRYFINLIAQRLTHLQEIRTGSPTWTGVIDASLEGMGGIFHITEGQSFVWNLPIGKKKSHHLLTEENTEGDITINDLKIAAYVAHIHIFAPLVFPLEHISTRVNNTAMECWD